MCVLLNPITIHTVLYVYLRNHFNSFTSLCSSYRSADVCNDFRLGDEGNGGPSLLAKHVLKQQGKDDNKCCLHFAHCCMLYL